MRLQGSVQPGQFGALEIEYSDAVTVLETQQWKIVYEGVIFDVTNEQIARNPALLNAAFGYYTYVVVDKIGGEIALGTDRFGFSPLYYSLVDEHLRFSSSITLLKGDLKNLTPNMDAWDEILILGDIIGEKTVVQEIQRLQWGRKISIRDGRVEFVTVWSPDVPSQCTRSEYIERNNELLSEAIRLTAAVRQDRVVALTGGQDSRRIAVALQMAGVEMACATQQVVGKGNRDEDTLIAKEVARALGASHTSVPVPAPQGMRADRSLKDYWGGYESNYHAWAVNFVRHLPRGSLIYDGIVGDVIVNGHYFRAYPEAISRYNDLDYLSERICGKPRTSVARKFLSAPLFERVRADLARFPDSPHRLTFFFLLNHTRRNIGSWLRLFGLFRNLPCTPYLYYPFFLQSLSLDPAEYLQSWMQNECIRAVNPHVARIPSTREPVPSEFLVDLSDLAAKQAAERHRPASVRSDVKGYLPGLAGRHYVQQISSGLRLKGLETRWHWASDTVQRFSEFLDWMDDAGPVFPAREDVPFVSRRFA
jgi:hypothetical protein